MEVLWVSLREAIVA